MLNLEPLRADAPLLPTVTAAGATWTLRKVAGAVADGLDYRVEVSTDGRTWSAAGTPGSASTVVADNASSLAVTLTSGSAPGLLRLMTVIPSALAGGAESFLPLEAAGEMNRGRDYLERSHGSAITPPE